MTLCLFSALQDAFMHSCAYFVQGGLCIQLFGSIPSVPFLVLCVAQLLQKFKFTFFPPKEGDTTYKHSKIHTCYMLRNFLLMQADSP